MKKQATGICMVIVLVLPALLIAGCQKAPAIPSNIHIDTFTATYQFAEDERSISISGNSDATPGGQSEYVLKINNGAERWQDEYYFLLLDSHSVIKEISHERLDIPAGGGIQKPITVEFPEGFEGALGLCVLVPQGGTLIAAISAGEENALATGWPDVRNYPLD
jgi:hypothetical protein